MGMDRGEWDELRAVYVQNLGATFCQKVAAYVKHFRWDFETFELQTGQTQDTYRRILRDDIVNPTKGLAMTFCVGLGLDYRMATDLLQSAGHALSPTKKVDMAYDYILLMYPGQGLEVCNRVLKAWGVNSLGVVKERKPNCIGTVSIR